MDFLEFRKKVTLQSGKELFIKRPGVGSYYRLLWASIGKADKDNINKVLQPFIESENTAFTLKETVEIIKLALEFNSVKKQSVEEFFGLEKQEEKRPLSETEKQEMLEKLDTAIGIIVDTLSLRGWTIRYILEKVNNVQVHYLMHYANQHRVANMLDAAAAHWGGIEERIDQIMGTINLGVMGD